MVTLGEAMLRLAAPPGRRIRESVELDVHVAGAEANVAVGLGHLGVPARWVSALPHAPAGDRVAAELAAAGVDLRFVTRMDDARLGLFFAEQAGAPRGSRVWYDRADSAFTRLSDLPAGALKDARYAVVSGITPALGPQSRALAAAFVAEAQRVGAALCVDVNYRALLWSPEEARDGLRDMLDGAAIVVCSERDARAVLGLGGTAEEIGGQLASTWAPAAGLVVITQASAGATIVTPDGVTSEPAITTDIWDRFGAGDALLAGLLWALYRGEPSTAALRAGMMLASLKCTTAGDIARFGSGELEHALASRHEEVIQR